MKSSQRSGRSMLFKAVADTTGGQSQWQFVSFSQTRNHFENLIVIRAFTNLREMNFLPTLFKTDQTCLCKIPRSGEVNADDFHLIADNTSWKFCHSVIGI